jgi:hypothetical protein
VQPGSFDGSIRCRVAPFRWPGFRCSTGISEPSQPSRLRPSPVDGPERRWPSVHVARRRGYSPRWPSRSWDEAGPRPYCPMCAGGGARTREAWVSRPVMPPSRPPSRWPRGRTAPGDGGSLPSRWRDSCRLPACTWERICPWTRWAEVRWGCAWLPGSGSRSRLGGETRDRKAVTRRPVGLHPRGIEPVVVDRPGVGTVYRSLRHRLYSRAAPAV